MHKVCLAVSVNIHGEGVCPNCFPPPCGSWILVPPEENLFNAEETIPRIHDPVSLQVEYVAYRRFPRIPERFVGGHGEYLHFAVSVVIPG